MSDDPTEVDATDQADSDQTEAAIASALSQVLHDGYSTGAGVPVGLSGTTWNAVIAAAVAATLANYAFRSTGQFGRAAGLSYGDSTRYAHDLTPTVVDDTVKRLATYAPDVVAHAQSEPTSMDQYRRLRVGSAQLAREAATYVREAARFKIATDLGAIDKVWRTKRDPRVRPAHGGIEGVRIPLADHFDTIDGPIRFPGDPTAKPSNVYGCRCHLGYLIPATKELVSA